MEIAYRLPTEAEWEFAARGGNKSGNYTYAGGENLQELGWFNENSYGKTMPVGLKFHNELGIHDMSGNVWEWCNDWWYDDYKLVAQTNTADTKHGYSRVLRGGSWCNNAVHCRPAARDYYNPTYRDNRYGFRLVISFLSV